MKSITNLMILKETPHHIFETSYAEFFHSLQNQLLKKKNVGPMIDDYNEEARAFVMIQLQVMEQSDLKRAASEGYPTFNESLLETVRTKEGSKVEEKNYFLTRRSKVLLKQRLH